MSHEAVTWAMDDAPMLLTDKGKPDTTARHVLQVLAEHANKQGANARPSLMRIQYRSGYDRRTVQRALRRLEEARLIQPTGVVNGCTVYRLTLATKRPAGDWAALEKEEDRQREVDAERQRRYRSRGRVTDANDVTVTDAESVTPDDRHALSVRTSRTQNPDVTDATPPEPSVEHVSEPSLSARVPQQPAETPTATSERETFGKTSNDDAAKVAVAWAAARGGPRNPGAEAKVAASARSFIAVGWSLPDLIELAEDMAHHDARYTDLATHEAQRTNRPAAASRLPDWCTRCGDGNPAAQTNARFRTSDGTAHGTKCTSCHPDTIKDNAA